MRPLKTKTTSKSAGIAGARLLLKSKLWWRWGFPWNGRWLFVPRSGVRRAEQVDLTRSDLSKATYAIKKLLGEFSKSLASVVGKVDRWEKNTRFLLDSVKEIVHKGAQSVPNHFLGAHYSKPVCQMAAKILSGNPELRPLVEAVSWLLLTEPSSALPYLRCIERETEGLKKLLGRTPGPDMMIFCIQLLHVGVKHGDGISDYVSIVSAPHAPFRGGDDYIQNIAKAAKSGKPHSAKVLTKSLAIELRNCMPWLVVADKKHQFRFLSLLSALELSDLFLSWSRFWTKATALAIKIENLRQSYDGKSKMEAHASSVDTALSALRKSCPQSLHEPGLVVALQWFTGEAASFHKLVMNALSGAKGLGHASRAYFLIHWHLLCVRGENHSLCLVGQDRKRFASLLRSFGEYVTKDQSDISPWRETVVSEGQKNRLRYTIDQDIAAAEMRLTDIPKVFSAFTQLRAMLQVQGEEPVLELEKVADEVVELVRFTGSGELSAQLAFSICEEKEYEKYYSDCIIKAALAASEGDRGKYLDLLRAFSRLEEKGTLEVLTLWKVLKGAFIEYPHLLMGLLLEKDQRKLLDSGEMIRALISLGGPFAFECSVKGDGPNWIDRFPPELHVTLAVLCLVCSDAELVARRVCKGVVRDTAALRRERDALILQLSDSSLAKGNHKRKRLGNIEALLESDEELSASEIETLNAKIQARAGRELLEQIHSRSKEQLIHKLRKYFEVESIPEWMLSPSNLGGVLSSLELGNRRLAKRLFQLRMGPAPWDMREEGPNRRFLLGLLAKGINTAPWLDGNETRCATTLGTIHLRLADDPLDVFRMGAYFKTCLSPSGMNFFSVFANAADINKRVLYAYNDEQKVIGRQLLCISDEGTIVAFHAYSHDGRWGFIEHASEFVSVLGKAMNTRSSAHGNVSTLVAGDWYDDGAVDVAGTLSFLEKDSSFLRETAKMEAREFVAALHAQRGETPLEQLLPLLFACPVFAMRPELTVSLIPELKLDRVERHYCIRVACQLDRVSFDFPPSLTKRLVDHIRKSFKVDRWVDTDALELVSRRNPVLGLRLLRQTRPRGVRSWKGEKRAERLLIGGRAMIVLHRPKKAVQLFTLATTAMYESQGAGKEARRIIDKMRIGG